MKAILIVSIHLAIKFLAKTSTLYRNFSLASAETDLDFFCKTCFIYIYIGEGMSVRPSVLIWPASLKISRLCISSLVFAKRSRLSVCQRGCLAHTQMHAQGWWFRRYRCAHSSPWCLTPSTNRLNLGSRERNTRLVGLLDKVIMPCLLLLATAFLLSVHASLLYFYYSFFYLAWNSLKTASVP